MERQSGFRVKNNANELDKSVTSKDAAEKLSRTNDVFKLIKCEKWGQLLDFLHNNEDAAAEWVTEHNPDGTVRWRSLPIHLACEKKPPVEALYNLLSLYPESIGKKNYGGDMPLHIACREVASKEVINFMILRDSFESTNERDCEGRFPLHLASRNGTDIKVIKDLLEVNSRAARTPDDFGLLPLHWACSKNASAEIVEALIDEYPYGIETKDAWGRTPLVLVKMSKNKEKAEIIELLSQDVSYWTTSLMNTIDTLSSKVINNGRQENQRKKLGAENQSLVTENCALKREINKLHKEIKKTEEGFLYEVEQIEAVHVRKIEKLKAKNVQEKSVLMKMNREAEKKITDLRSLVNDVVEKLKVQKELVDEKEESRKELKDKAVALVKRIQEEKNKTKEIASENVKMRMRESSIIVQLKERNQQLNEVKRSLNTPMELLYNASSSFD